MEFMSEGCSIRPLKHEDLLMVLSWRNRPEVRQYMLTQREIGLDEHSKWFDKASQDKTRRLLIVEDSLQPVGFVQLNNVCGGGISDWGFYVRPDAPKGSGRKLGLTTLTYAFNELGLHKVCGQVIDSNHVSIAFHNRLGFKREGALRDQQRIHGVYYTLIYFGLLAQEWLPENLLSETTNDYD